VRIYHPDSAMVRSLGLPAEVAHDRFQSISRAYDLLRGKTLASLSADGAAKPESTAARRTKQARQAELHTGFDDRWKDRVIVGAVIVVCCFAAGPVCHREFTEATDTLFIRRSNSFDSPAGDHGNVREGSSGKACHSSKPMVTDTRGREASCTRR
jgi:hypothetical protein